MATTTEGEWLALVAPGPRIKGGFPVRVLLDDGREVVAALPKSLARSLVSAGQRLEVTERDSGPPRIVRFLNNRGPRSPFLRVTRRPEGRQAIQFITFCRMYTSADLATAKRWFDQLVADGVIDLYPPDARSGRRLGVDLLAAGVLTGGVELVYPDGRPTEVLSAPPPPPPPPPCPSCGTPLSNGRAECGACGWLKYPGDATRWGRAGACGRCGFGYRWDGAHCSHCGFGAADGAPQER